MWLLKRKRRLSFNSNQELYAYIDSLIERLKELSLVAPAQELHTILHESARTTASEPLGEIKLALLRIKTQHRGELPRELESDISSCGEVIEDGWKRANGQT
jgi:hypothetical protein